MKINKRVMTMQEFVNKMEWEGGPSAMYDYIGSNVRIDDDQELNNIWQSFCQAHLYLNDYIDEYAEYEDEGE